MPSLDDHELYLKKIYGFPKIRNILPKYLCDWGEIRFGPAPNFAVVGFEA